MAAIPIISQDEARGILREAAIEIQAIDNTIADLKEDKKEILKAVKDKGLDRTVLNKAIARLRQAKKKPRIEDEIDLYVDVIKDLIK